jgi:hypothetical protein
MNRQPIVVGAFFTGVSAHHERDTATHAKRPPAPSAWYRASHSETFERRSQNRGPFATGAAFGIQGRCAFGDLRRD